MQLIYTDHISVMSQYSSGPCINHQVSVGLSCGGDRGSIFKKNSVLLNRCGATPPDNGFDIALKSWTHIHTGYFCYCGSTSCWLSNISLTSLSSNTERALVFNIFLTTKTSFCDIREIFDDHVECVMFG